MFPILDLVEVLPANSGRGESKSVQLRWSVNPRVRVCVGAWKGLLSMFGIGMEDFLPSV